MACCLHTTCMHGRILIVCMIVTVVRQYQWQTVRAC